MLEAWLTCAYTWLRTVVERVSGTKRRRETVPPVENSVSNGASVPPPKRVKPNTDAGPSNQEEVFYDAVEELEEPPKIRRTNKHRRLRKPSIRELKQIERSQPGYGAEFFATALANKQPTLEEHMEVIRKHEEAQAQLRREKRAALAASRASASDSHVEPQLEPQPQPDGAMDITMVAESSKDAEIRSILAYHKQQNEKRKRLKAAKEAEKVEAPKEAAVAELPLRWQEAYLEAQTEGNKVVEPFIWKSVVIQPGPPPQPSKEATLSEMYQIKSDFTPLEEVPPRTEYMDIDLSPVTLQALATYFPVRPKPAAKTLAEDEMEVDEPEGIPAWEPEILNDEDVELYESIDPKDDHQFSINIDNCDFTAHDISTLMPGEWLNDIVVNGYMKLLQMRDAKLEDGPSCHFCKTFLMHHIYPHYNYDHIKKWTMTRRLKNWGQTKENILECDLIFFPVHINLSHWVLAVAKLSNKVLEFYDSLGENLNEHDENVRRLMRNVSKYLVDEAAHKLGEDWSIDDFGHRLVREMPQQDNMSDCGVYICRTAKEISGQNSLHYTAEEMRYYRMLMLKEFRHGELL